jgi:hypothetical protein
MHPVVLSSEVRREWPRNEGVRTRVAWDTPSRKDWRREREAVDGQAEPTVEPIVEMDMVDDAPSMDGLQMKSERSRSGDDGRVGALDDGLDGRPSAALAAAMREGESGHGCGGSGGNGVPYEADGLTTRPACGRDDGEGVDPLATVVELTTRRPSSESPLPDEEAAVDFSESSWTRWSVERPSCPFALPPGDAGVKTARCCSTAGVAIRPNGDVDVPGGQNAGPAA